MELLGLWRPPSRPDQPTVGLQPGQGQSPACMTDAKDAACYGPHAVAHQVTCAKHGRSANRAGWAHRQALSAQQILHTPPRKASPAAPNGAHPIARAARVASTGECSTAQRRTPPRLAARHRSNKGKNNSGLGGSTAMKEGRDATWELARLPGRTGHSTTRGGREQTPARQLRFAVHTTSRQQCCVRSPRRLRQAR